MKKKRILKPDYEREYLARKKKVKAYYTSIEQGMFIKHPILNLIGEIKYIRGSVRNNKEMYSEEILY